MNSNQRFLLWILALCVFSHSAFAADKIRIVTTTSTLASIAQAIVQDKAEIHSVAPPNRDVHFITPTPRDVLKTRKADVFIHGGLDLEVWRGPLLDAVGKKEFLSGEKAIDASQGVTLLEVPSSVSRLEGDVHVFGNPHYWLDPLNAKIIAENIAERLARMDPEETVFFRENAGAFAQKMDEKMKDWERQTVSFKGQPVIVYHNSWPYFMERFGFVTVGFLEPKPGIPPTGRHLKEISATMKEKKVKLIVKEVFRESRAPKKLARETGAAVVSLATEPAQIHGDYFAFIEHNLQELEKALRS